MNDKTRAQIEAMKKQTSKAGFGSFSGIRAFSDRTQKNANWSPQSSSTRTSKPCRTSSDCFARREGKVDPAAAAVSIFTLEKATTPQRPCGI